METYIIYKIFNKISGKAYIGRTKDLERRIKEHIKRSDCRALHRAIKKYGIENFTIGVLYESNNFHEIIKAEQKFIASENTMIPNGYNLVLETAQGRSPSSETRKIMSSSVQKRLKRGISSYTGVKEDKNKKGFTARTTFKKKTYYKYFKTKEAAAEAYDKVNLYLRGVGCGLNFPDKLQEYLKEDLEAYFLWFTQKKQSLSKYIGVSFHKKSNKWRAYFYQNKKQVSLGLFETEEEAYQIAKKYYK